MPVERFALTHYHFQLVLVGGAKPGCDDLTNEVWVSEDGTDWQPSLPPMRVKRCDAAAVNTGFPECLVVAGGCGATSEWLNVVEVLVNEEWFTVQPLPNGVRYPRAFIHNGTLITGIYPEYCCCVESLLASRFQDKKKLLSYDLWKNFPRGSSRYMFSFGQQLVTAGAGVKVLCPYTHTWLDIGRTWNKTYICGTVLATGEMMIVHWEGSVQKASLKCK